jgi:outer membrane protein TolC
VQQAIKRAEQTAIDARSEVREAYGAYRTAFDVAKHHRDEIVPLRKKILEENVLRYNGMLIGVFELLADARVQIASVNAAIEAQRDFWLADADLDMALVGKPTLAPMAGPATPMSAGNGDAH